MNPCVAVELVGEKATRRESNRQQHPRAFGQMIKPSGHTRTQEGTHVGENKRESVRKQLGEKARIAL